MTVHEMLQHYVGDIIIKNIWRPTYASTLDFDTRGGNRKVSISPSISKLDTNVDYYTRATPPHHIIDSSGTYTTNMQNTEILLYSF